MRTHTSGYPQPHLYLQQRDKHNQRHHGHFSLGYALQRWQHRLAPAMLAHRLGTAPRCLLSGCASRDNVPALLHFLTGQHVTQPQLDVIDLIDLQALGRSQAGARFHKADAADLRALFADGSVDLIVQDHLLNCAPVSQYDAIVAEMARILRPGGLLLLHYTDSSGLPAPTHHPAPVVAVDSCFNLARPELVDQPVHARLFAGREGVTLVTRPYGNLEHFIPFAALQQRLHHHGLELETAHGSDFIDDEGLHCHRNHCLIRRR